MSAKTPVYLHLLVFLDVETELSLYLRDYGFEMYYFLFI